MIEVKRGVFNFCAAGTGYPCVMVRTVRDEMDCDGFWHYSLDELSHKVFTPEHLSAFTQDQGEGENGSGGDSGGDCPANTHTMLQLRGRLFPAPSSPETLMDVRYGAQWRTSAVCLKLRGDRFYGRLPMAAQLHDGSWIRVDSLSTCATPLPRSEGTFDALASGSVTHNEMDASVHCATSSIAEGAVAAGAA